MGEPTLSEWEALYDAAEAFKALEPWTLWRGEEPFAVQNPEDGTVGYCCIMGELGEMPGLVVHLGDAGFAGYLRMVTENLAKEPWEACNVQYALMASFENRDEVTAQDRRVMKALNRKYRGANAWPRFRFFEPGYVPWYLTGPQARFLTTALEQATQLAARLQRGEGLAVHLSEDEILLRVREPAGAWVDRAILPPWGILKQSNRRVVPNYSEWSSAEFAAFQRSVMEKQGGTWEVDFFFVPAVIQEGKNQRPYMARCALFADAQSGFLLAHSLAEVNEFDCDAQRQFLKAIYEMRHAPEKIAATKPEVLDVLAPVAMPLGIRLEQVKRAPMVREGRREIIKRMERAQGRG